MSFSSTTITVTGNLVEDPELRFTPSGQAVCNIAVASQDRKFNKDTNEWEDGETTFLRGSCWRRLAEHTAESCRKGDRVIVTGRLQQRSYETSDGEKRTVYEIQVDDIGRSLMFAPVLHTNAAGQKVTREGASPAPSADDPWATPASDGPPF